jgi:c-di-GMP-binding flagellar brake protein YcgR
MYKRLAVQTGCWLVEQDGISCLHTCDLSDEGVSVVGAEPLPVGRVIYLQFFTHQSAAPTRVEAEVVWVRDEADACVMGLKFIGVDPVTRQTLRALAEFLRQRSLQSPE